MTVKEVLSQSEIDSLLSAVNENPENYISQDKEIVEEQLVSEIKPQVKIFSNEPEQISSPRSKRGRIIKAEEFNNGEYIHIKLEKQNNQYSLDFIPEITSDNMLHYHKDYFFAKGYSKKRLT